MFGLFDKKEPPVTLKSFVGNLNKMTQKMGIPSDVASWGVNDVGDVAFTFADDVDPTLKKRLQAMMQDVIGNTGIGNIADKKDDLTIPRRAFDRDMRTILKSYDEDIKGLNESFDQTPGRETLTSVSAIERRMIGALDKERAKEEKIAKSAGRGSSWLAVFSGISLGVMAISAMEVGMAIATGGASLAVPLLMTGLYAFNSAILLDATEDMAKSQRAAQNRADSLSETIDRVESRGFADRLREERGAPKGKSTPMTL